MRGRLGRGRLVGLGTYQPRARTAGRLLNHARRQQGRSISQPQCLLTPAQRTHASMQRAPGKPVMPPYFFLKKKPGSYNRRSVYRSRPLYIRSFNTTHDARLCLHLHPPLATSGGMQTTLTSSVSALMQLQMHLEFSVMPEFSTSTKRSTASSCAPSRVMSATWCSNRKLL